MAQGRSKAVICSKCRKDDVRASLVATRKLQNAQTKAHALAKICSACNLCFEDGSTFAAIVQQEPSFDGVAIGTARQRKVEGISIPMASCTCIDCPTTFDRHRLREEGLEAEAICKALDIL